MMLVALISVFIYLLSNGSLVSINVTTVQSTALLNVTLPVKPLGPIIVQNSSGSIIPAILIGNHLIIPVFGNGSFTIQYAPYVTQSPSSYLIINVSSQYSINLFVSNNVLITQLPIDLITNFTRVSNGIMLQLASGNYSIGFVPELPIANKTSITTKTTTTSVGNTNAVTTITNSSVPVTAKVVGSSSIFGSMLYYVMIVIIVAVAALLTYLFVIRRRGPEVNPVIVEGLNQPIGRFLRH